MNQMDDSIDSTLLMLLEIHKPYRLTFKKIISQIPSHMDTHTWTYVESSIVDPFS